MLIIGNCVKVSENCEMSLEGEHVLLGDGRVLDLRGLDLDERKRAVNNPEDYADRIRESRGVLNG